MHSMRRRDMKPGQMFAHLPPRARAAHKPPLLLVVVDNYTEVGFWTGERWAIGDVAPGSTFEVV